MASIELFGLSKKHQLLVLSYLSLIRYYQLWIYIKCKTFQRQGLFIKEMYIFYIKLLLMELNILHYLLNCLHKSFQ